ncbi:MAG: ATP-binding cassette domain-containing protein [Spirochaetota bacterium]
MKKQILESEEARVPPGKGEDFLVQMIDIHKWFGKVCALKGVNFEVRENEIVGLVGDNGAGKSTLIKILSGFHTADRGEIFFEGKKVNINNPKDAKTLGIETVYQEQALSPHVSIARNIFMGREQTRFLGFMNKKKMDKESLETLSTIGLHLKDPEAMVESLSGGQRQGVAIARVLYFKAKLVILDEPTIALSVKESQQVMEFIKQLKAEGISVVFITHNLFHAFQIAERFVVLAHGEGLANVKREETSIDHLSHLIITGRGEEK